MGNPSFGMTGGLQAEKTTPIVCDMTSHSFLIRFFFHVFYLLFCFQNQVENVYADNYFNGLYTPYGPHPIVSPPYLCNQDS